jgi:DNA-binding CsgD family transcriptional regulator
MGYQVLAANPTGSETRLSFSGIADLLSSVSADVFERLPGVQRGALEIALLRRDVRPSGQSGRVVATALLSVLQALATMGRVLLAVDDAQWLDAASFEALSFAVRRTDELPVRTLVSVRVDGHRPPTFEQSLPIEQRHDIVLGPLTTAALHDVIKGELSRSLPRPLVVQIAITSGGNPMYAVEIARELGRTGIPSPGRPLRVPEELMTLVRARVSRMPARTRDALLVAACLSQPTVGLVDVDALVPAEESGIVVIEEGGRISFTHPLLAAAVYESASGPKRRRVHRDLAARLTDTEERARHLGLAAEGPNEETAAELDAAADLAAARGAATAACDLCRRALELTVDPKGERAARRSLALATHLLDIGQTHEAKTLLEAALETRPTDELLAQVLLGLGNVCWYERDFDRGYEYLIQALAHASDPQLVARIHNQAAWISESIDLGRAIAHEDAVLQLLTPGPGPYSFALMYRAYLGLINGQGADQEAIDLGMHMGGGEYRDDTSPVPIVWPMFMDDFTLARERLVAAVADASALGDEASMQTFLGHLAAIECWTGNLALADEYASRAIELSERIASPAYLGSALFARGYVDAHLGHIDEANDAGRRILELYAAYDDPQLVFGHWLLGLAALFVQDLAEADRQLGRAAEVIDGMGQREPVRCRLHPDRVEAVIGLGDLDRADGLIARLEDRSRAFPRPWLLATTARCRGLLLSARGDLDGALASLRAAQQHHDDVEMPFERARTLVALGQVLRRRREKREARSVLENALAEFERLGARTWAERTRAELARIPVHQSASALSATEAEIARLAASGLTNRQIADRAFVSPKTVEANMSRIYGKLGIRTRAELGRAMADLERATQT